MIESVSVCDKNVYMFILYLLYVCICVSMCLSV